MYVLALPQKINETDKYDIDRYTCHRQINIPYYTDTYTIYR